MHKTFAPKDNRIILTIKGGKQSRRSVKQTGAGTHGDRRLKRLKTRATRNAEAFA